MLVCKDCGGEFVFGVEEQEKYADRGFAEPKRCPACRAARRAQKERQSQSRDRYSGGRAGGGRPSGRSRGQPGGRREPRELVTITCAACGREAQVPFTPAPGRPVYCPDCYRAQRGEH